MQLMAVPGAARARRVVLSAEEYLLLAAAADFHSKQAVDPLPCLV